MTITLQLHTAAVAPYIAPSLIFIAMESCYDVGVPRFHNPSSEGDPRDAGWENCNRHIPMTRIMSLLYLTALGCAASPPVHAGSVTPPIADFWSQVHVQFIGMLLSPKQPVEDFLATLRLLCTSVTPHSVGPTPPGQAATPELGTSYILERMSARLVEAPPPRWGSLADGSPAAAAAALRGIRNEVLKTLAAFARSEVGLVRMASSEYVVPRLVSLIYASIDELYDGGKNTPYTTTSAAPPPAPTTTSASRLTPSSSSSEPSSSSSLLSLLDVGASTLIANAVLVLHTIVRSPATRDLVNVPAKLAQAQAQVPGGSHKYLLALARLNFAETDLYDGGDDGDGAGIGEETAELAHELLELAVTEEEGAELGVYFGGIA